MAEKVSHVDDERILMIAKLELQEKIVLEDIEGHLDFQKHNFYTLGCVNCNYFHEKTA